MENSDDDHGKSEFSRQPAELVDINIKCIYYKHTQTERKKTVLGAVCETEPRFTTDTRKEVLK